MVYNQSFEMGRLNDLARWLPEYAVRVALVQERIWDLLPVVRQNVYHPDFCNSFSIKTVLPALVPEMSYDGMAVAEGSEAGLAFERMVHPNTPDFERAQIREDLLAYCFQDTLAMVKILDVLNTGG